MNDSARERIFANLRAALRQGGFDAPPAASPALLTLNRQERIDRLIKLMENMHTQVQLVKRDTWLEALKALVKERRFNNLLYGPGSPFGATLENHWADDLPPLLPYSESIESFKETLFGIDAAITSTKGGIAETGALILWPDIHEPRLMSLVPTVHIAVLDADRIYSTFLDAMTAERWQDGMPTNALLISGPSKTADIELTLTFGVHGPKELALFIVDG